MRNLTNCPSEASLEVLHDISKLEGFTLVQATSIVTKFYIRCPS